MLLMRLSAISKRLKENRLIILLVLKNKLLKNQKLKIRTFIQQNTIMDSFIRFLAQSQNNNKT